MQHFIEFEVVAVLVAERHEGTEVRIGNCSGSLCRSITTKWLILTCRFPTSVLQFLLRRRGRLPTSAGLRRSSSTASPPIKSLRKNGQKRRVPPSRDLITRCSGWISLIQRFRTPDFRRFAPLGLPGSRLIGTPLGNHLLMPPPSPV
jgi:hypothetical protein